MLPTLSTVPRPAEDRCGRPTAYTAVLQNNQRHLALSEWRGDSTGRETGDLWLGALAPGAAPPSPLAWVAASPSDSACKSADRLSIRRKA